MKGQSFKNIVLIGFMGIGKSLTGKVLANMLGYKFVDINQELENACQMSILEMSQRFSEKQILELQQAAIHEIYLRNKQVIALSADAIKNVNSIRALKYNGHFIWLKAPFPEILARIIVDDDNGIKRPITYNYNQYNMYAKCRKSSTAQRLYTDLSLLYEMIADNYIDISQKPVEVICSAINKMLVNNDIVINK